MKSRAQGKAVGWVLFIIAVVLGWLFFEDAEETAVDDSASGVAALVADSYAARPLANTWPADAGSAGVAGADLAAVNYYLVMDGSGSMNSDECTDGRPKIEAAVEAVKAFVGAVPAAANLGLMAFDAQGIGERVPLGAANRDAVNQQLDAIVAENSTPLRSAIGIGFGALTTQAQAQLGYGEYHLVVVTDGYAEPAEEDPGELVSSILHDSPVVLHVIGFCIGEDHVLNQPGRTLYTAADSVDALRAGLSAVLAEAPDFSATDFPAP